ncbi:PHD finger-like domain-containing protein 5A [Angomonas deanei]|uniref:PHF5-like protein, putative n=1 Tax=Angomonas deanei TaxID=59799 RepID=S9V7S6_9TRYP|nr:PHD finger-like domain-containing protein 5A [Angomonas deanei]EPY39907.1 PHD finger-like domain-containing protein 5A [Angomonas deanei]CAD2214451.1 PHF5-like protein, putative [Angomonas deanei]|eukprot:EPY39062.1 PHD finger-like domain-containing protein 5A [Angomonas deanei]
MLRHARDDLQMCRKRTGMAVGYVCNQHEGRCVVCDLQCDEILPTMREVHLCDDCGLVAEGQETCVMCGTERISELAYYCSHCVALGKEADGCPRVMNKTKQQRLAVLRAAAAAPK